MSTVEIFDPFVIPTENSEVLLRELIPEDAPYYFAALDADHAHVNQFGEDLAIRYPTEEHVRQSIAEPSFINRLKMGIWADNTFVGSANLTSSDDRTAELGYWLGRQYCGNGYATIAARALANYGLEHYRTINASVRHGNLSSIAVLGRVGFRLAESSATYHHYIYS